MLLGSFRTGSKLSTRQTVMANQSKRIAKSEIAFVLEAAESSRRRMDERRCNELQRVRGILYAPFFYAAVDFDGCHRGLCVWSRRGTRSASVGLERSGES